MTTTNEDALRMALEEAINLRIALYRNGCDCGKHHTCDPMTDSCILRWTKALSAQSAQAPDELDLARFVNGIREFVLGQLHGTLEQTGYDRVRAVDPAWLANTVLESQGQPLPTKPQCISVKAR